MATACGIIHSGLDFSDQYDSNYELLKKIYLLKQLKFELKIGVNRFENTDVTYFNEELENQFKKTK